MNPLLFPLLASGLWLIWRRWRTPPVTPKRIVGPLRPTPPKPGAPPPGPAAQRLAEFLDDLSDRQVAMIRTVLPPGWWHYFAAAVHAPDDESFRFILHPMSIDYMRMSQAELEQLQTGFISSVGVYKSLAVREILQDAGLM